jgi:hypothetical protein
MEVRWEPFMKEGKDPGDVPTSEMRYIWQPKFGKVSYKGRWNMYWGESQTLKVKAPGRDAIWRVSEATWWEWIEGSAPFYWCWLKEYHTTIRDGLEIWFSGEKPAWKRPQRVERNEETRKKVVGKIATVRKRKYIAAGYVASLTDFFSVPKGRDIRMVYKGPRAVSTTFYGYRRFLSPLLTPCSVQFTLIRGWQTRI